MSMNGALTFLQIGLGSMGKRRIRNLRALREERIIGFDTSPVRRAEAARNHGVETIETLGDLDPTRYDVMIISTPPNQHGEYMRSALRHDKHFFVEQSTSTDGYDEVIENSSDKVHAPSSTFRYFSPIKEIQKLLTAQRIGTVLAYQYHLGQYLSDWHPWEDYRTVYFAKKETGALREMFPFELGWLTWLVGAPVAEVCGYIAKVSDLEMTADDLFVVALKHAQNNVFGSLLLDVFCRQAERILRLYGTQGVLEWNWLASTIDVYDARTKTSERIVAPQTPAEPGYLNPEDMYREEMGIFLDAVYGRSRYPYTFKEDRINLQALFALEEAAKSRRCVQV